MLTIVHTLTDLKIFSSSTLQINPRKNDQLSLLFTESYDLIASENVFCKDR